MRRETGLKRSEESSRRPSSTRTLETAEGVTGLQAAGVAAGAKHFPGHGDTHLDSHHAAPALTIGLDELERLAAPEGQVGRIAPDVDRCGVLLRQRQVNVHPAPAEAQRSLEGRDRSVAPSGGRERLTQSLERVLHQSGYIKPGAARSIRFQIREMLHRLQLSAKDTHWILGMLSRIHRRLGQLPPDRN